MDTKFMVTTKQKSRAETQNIKQKKLRKKSQKTIKLKWNTETQRKRKNGDIEQSENEKMAVLDPRLSVATLNINGLNSPIRGHRVTGQIRK